MLRILMKTILTTGLIACISITATSQQRVNDFHFDSLLAIQKAKKIPFLEKLGLEQNYPNPFSQSEETIFAYKAIDSHSVSLIIYSSEGKIIIFNPLKTGVGTVKLKGSDLTAGTYVYALFVNERIVERRKMVVTE